jgi:hypothetical protein
LPIMLRKPCSIGNPAKLREGKGRPAGDLENEEPDSVKKPPLALVSDGCRGVSYEARDHQALHQTD